MKSVKRRVAGISAAAVCCAGVFGLATETPAATNDERTCRGTIGAQSLDVDIRVPSGATCTLNRTRVDGNVKVYRGATLLATNVRVGGNIEADNAKRVVVTGSRATNIQLKQGRGGSIELTGNTVGADIQLFSNVGTSIVVRRNVVDGNLQCKSNKPRPTGGANQVEGNKEDQCARL